MLVARNLVFLDLKFSKDILGGNDLLEKPYLKYKLSKVCCIIVAEVEVIPSPDSILGVISSRIDSRRTMSSLAESISSKTFSSPAMVVSINPSIAEVDSGIPLFPLLSTSTNPSSPRTFLSLVLLIILKYYLE